MACISGMSGERAAARLKVFEPTAMQVGAETARVHLLDLSASGALVHATRPPAMGARVQVSCGGEMRSARVVWVKGQRFGLAFTVPLTEDRIADTLAHRHAAAAG